MKVERLVPKARGTVDQRRLAGFPGVFIRSNKRKRRITDMASIDEIDPQMNNGDVFSRVEGTFRTPVDHVLQKYGYNLKGSSMSKHDHQFYSHYRTGHSLVVNPEGFWMHMWEGGSDAAQVESGRGAADTQYERADDLLRRAAARSRSSQGLSKDSLYVNREPASQVEVKTSES
jgi:hypothetical protein